MRQFATLCLLLALGGCGQMGPLYMPDNPAPGQAEVIAGGSSAEPAGTEPGPDETTEDEEPSR